ncbi:MAG: Rpn family recombination-promoting nuclease/putative transposase [Magnetococcales bacterium]|nr:Rpn family recombination-promoting nuclease/putative transposase [Magnetococcales bacterium]
MTEQEHKVSQIHDHFCRAVVSDPVKAAGLIQEQLPITISSCLSPELPTLVEGSFVDETLRGLLSDRLYQVRILTGQTAFIYVLIDHKSHPDPFVAWQLLKYIVEIWKQWERENAKWTQLPPIIPLVLYHGVSQWRIADEFLALVAAEEGWQQYLLNFQFRVMDLGPIPDQQLSRHPKLRVCLLAMKYATRDKQQLQAKELIIEALLEAPEELPLVFRYLSESYPAYDEQVLREIVQRVLPQEEEVMMSQFAQENVQRGIKIGQQDGERQGETRMLLRLLHRRFSTLPSWVEKKVLDADLDALAEWADRFVNASSLQDIFGDDAQIAH